MAAPSAVSPDVRAVEAPSCLGHFCANKNTAFGPVAALPTTWPSVGSEQARAGEPAEVQSEVTDSRHFEARRYCAFSRR
jgi:hypothetical protein